MTTTWILVADGSRARVYSTIGPAAPLNVVPKFKVDEKVEASQELARDRPGRTYQSVGHKRSAIEPRVDPHQRAETELAERLARDLDEALEHKAFDRLVVAAPPRFLGDLRSAYSDRLRRTIHGEVAKDLTKVAPADLRNHLGDIVV